MRKARNTLFALVALAIVAISQDDVDPARYRAIRQVTETSRFLEESGFSPREPVWSGIAEPGKTIIVPVYLFAKNDYFFVTSVTGEDPAMEMLLFGNDGEKIDVVPVSGETGTVLTFTPGEGDRYFIWLRLPEGKEARHIALGYSFR